MKPQQRQAVYSSLKKTFPNEIIELIIYFAKWMPCCKCKNVIDSTDCAECECAEHDTYESKNRLLCDSCHEKCPDCGNSVCCDCLTVAEYCSRGGATGGCRFCGSGQYCKCVEDVECCMDCLENEYSEEMMEREEREEYYDSMIREKCGYYK
jgi:hypothetical protein